MGHRSRGAVVTRVILAAHSLWLLLSRPDLPRLADFPPEILQTIPYSLKVRTLFLFGPSVEMLLYGGALIVMMLLLVGRAPDWMVLAAGVLMMHFGALEEILAGMPHSYFGGFTIPALAFPVLYAGRLKEKWAVVAIRGLVISSYFFAGVAKLIYSGPRWFSADTLYGWLVVRHSYADAPLALWLSEQTMLLWGAVLVIGVIELGSPVLLFRPSLGSVFVLVAMSAHVVIRYAMGIFFPGVLLALLLVDWDSFGHRRSKTEKGPADVPESADQKRRKPDGLSTELCHGQFNGTLSP